MPLVPEEALGETRRVVRIALDDAVTAAFDRRRGRSGGLGACEQRKGEGEHHLRPNYAGRDELAMTEPPRHCEGRGPSHAVASSSAGADERAVNGRVARMERECSYTMYSRVPT